MATTSDSPPATTHSPSSASDTEKNISTTITKEREEDYNRFIDERGFHGAHILDASQLHDANLQTTKDGKTILIPQPSSDPNDPLNWSSVKKHLILMVITVATFVPDFGSSMGVITLLPQSKCVYVPLPPLQSSSLSLPPPSQLPFNCLCRSPPSTQPLL